MTDQNRELVSFIVDITLKAIIQPEADRKGGLSIDEYQELYKKGHAFLKEYLDEEATTRFQTYFPEVCSTIRGWADDVMKKEPLEIIVND